MLDFLHTANILRHFLLYFLSLSCLAFWWFPFIEVNGPGVVICVCSIIFPWIPLTWELKTLTNLLPISNDVFNSNIGYRDRFHGAIFYWFRNLDTRPSGFFLMRRNLNFVHLTNIIYYENLRLISRFKFWLKSKKALWNRSRLFYSLVPSLQKDLIHVKCLILPHSNDTVNRRRLIPNAILNSH